MNKEKRKIMIFSVLGLVVSLVGLSYAFFMGKVSGDESESIIYSVAANLTIEFREGTSQISASDIFPGWSATKTIYVKNNSASEGEYSLKIFDEENGLMVQHILMYSLMMLLSFKKWALAHFNYLLSLMI